MKTYYSDYLELAESVYNKAVNEECDVEVVGDYWTIESILQFLIYTDANNDQILSLAMIELQNPDISDYDGLYLLQVSEYCEVYVEKAVNLNGELYVLDNEVLFVEMKYWDKIKGKVDEDQVVETIIFTDDQSEFEAFKEGADVTLVKDDEVVKTIIFEKNSQGYCMHAEICSCDGFENKTINEIVDGLVEIYNKGI